MMRRLPLSDRRRSCSLPLRCVRASLPADFQQEVRGEVARVKVLVIQPGRDEWTEPIALTFSAWDIDTGQPTP